MNLSNLLAAHGSSPGFLALSILVSTFFLEDIAIGYAALVAAMGLISIPFAFSALFLGVYLGDLGLYLLGYLARRYRRIRRYFGEGQLERAREWVDRRAVTTLIAARVLPGSRLPIYAAGGYLQMSFRRFAAITAATSLAWTTVLFIAAYAFGIRADHLPNGLKIGVIVTAGLAMFVAPLLLTRRLKGSAKAMAA